jgi:hypothetical protein
MLDRLLQVVPLGATTGVRRRWPSGTLRLVRMVVPAFEHYVRGTANSVRRMGYKMAGICAGGLGWIVW